MQCPLTPPTPPTPPTPLLPHLVIAWIHSYNPGLSSAQGDTALEEVSGRTAPFFRHLVNGVVHAAVRGAWGRLAVRLVFHDPPVCLLPQLSIASLRFCFAGCALGLELLSGHCCRRFFVLLDSGDLLDFSSATLESVGGLTRVQDCRTVVALPASDTPSGCMGLLLTRGEDGKGESIACSDKDDVPAFRDVWEPMLKCYPGTSSDPSSPADAAATAMAVLLGALAHDIDSTRPLIRSDKIAQVSTRGGEWGENMGERSGQAGHGSCLFEPAIPSAWCIHGSYLLLR